MALLQTVLVSLLITHVSPSLNNNDYAVPEPEFIVSKTALQVTIPDEEGIEIFYFYGRVNRKNEKPLETNVISMDTRKKTDNQWILEDRNVQLQIGDTINYWIFVRKNGVGYRRSTTSYEVRDLVTFNKTALELQQSNLTPDEISTNPEHTNFEYTDPVNIDSRKYVDESHCQVDCTNQLSNMTKTVTVMQNQMESLEKVVKHLVQVMTEQFGNLTGLDEWTVVY